MAEARTIVPGLASGIALVLDEPLSFWGGIDPATGALIDTHHPQRGANVAGRILVMPSGRGSSSSSYVLAEAIRAGTSPAAMLLLEPDGILALGAIVGRALYGVAVPVVLVDRSSYGRLRTGDPLDVDARTPAASVSERS